MCRQGVATADDPRFVRAWWEVPTSAVGLDRDWAPFAKSSEYSPYWDDLVWVIRWKNDGQEIGAFDRSRPQNTSYFGRSGITYPARSVLGFNPRAFPARAGFGHMGSVAFPRGIGAGALVGYLASRPLEYVLSFSNGSLQGKKGAYPNHYEVGQIKELPWPPFTPEELTRLEAAGTSLCTAAMHLQDDDETTHQYTGRPLLAATTSLVNALRATFERRHKLVEEARAARLALDAIVAHSLRFDEADLVEMNGEFAACEQPGSGPWSPNYLLTDTAALRLEAAALLSELIGMAYGRFDVRYAAAVAPASPPQGVFEPFPAGPPALLGEVPHGYPLEVALDGILVDDPGHPRDIEAALRRVIETIWGERAVEIEGELTALLGIESLRPCFRDSGAQGFFSTHVNRYSQSRRSAPIFWRLGPPSGQYSIFVYALAASADLLFTLHQDYVLPKVLREEVRLEALRGEVGEKGNARQRRLVAAQENFVTELRAFAAHVKQLAPLWNPVVDDGIVLNTALLWRLFGSQRSWQSQSKATWDELSAHTYDWSHLAMRLWPAIVVPKCATDRSLAMAHGLEDVFWIEINGRWQPRAAPTRSVSALVRERTSPAIKAALASLLAAPVAAAPRGRGKGSRARRPTPQNVRLMHPFHDYVASQLADKLKARQVVVWYDPRREFVPFVAEVRGGVSAGAEPSEVRIGGVDVRLAEYSGSMFELRAVVEPWVSQDGPGPVLVYLPGCERDERGSLLMELELAGERYERQLRRLARNVLRGRGHTDGIIDSLLAPDAVTYDDLVAAMTDAGAQPSLLTGIFAEVKGQRFHRGGLAGRRFARRDPHEEGRGR